MSDLQTDIRELRRAIRQLGEAVRDEIPKPVRRWWGRNEHWLVPWVAALGIVLFFIGLTPTFCTGDAQ